MKRRFCLFLLLTSIAWLGGPARAAEQELGGGLVYVRVHKLPADLPEKPAGRVPPCVIDVRYVEADRDAATAFAAWLKFRVAPRSPVFVLANLQTGEELRRALAARDLAPGVMVVGIEAGRFRPDVAVNATAENERRAYDAFESGAALRSLLTDNPRKVRNDEASLNKERSAVSPAEAADAAKVPVDATLQRAVHLHRALVALRKI